MLLLSEKTCPALLWTITVLFAVESLTVPTPQPDPEDLTVLYGEKESRPATWKPTHKPAEVSVAAATESTVLPTVETQEANSLKDSTVALVVITTAAETAATSGSDHRLLQTAKAETTAAGEDRLYSSTDKHAQDQSHQPSATTYKDTTAPSATPATFTSTVVVSSPQPTSIIKPEVTSHLSSTFSSHESTQIFKRNLNIPSASTAATMTTNPTSEAAPVFNPTSMPGATTETSKTRTELPSTSHPFSATTVLASTGARESSSMPTSVPTDPPSSTVSNSSVGVLIPRNTKKPPVPTFIPTPATTAAPRHITKSPSSTETQPCSTRSLARNCLIVIAVLAALATIFMVSTIVLCTKLSAKKHRAKKSQQDTEMMCISALLKEPSYTYTRQRNPVRNGVLVIPGGGDSDDDLGDNLTLSSFLPENDRYV